MTTVAKSLMAPLLEQEPHSLDAEQAVLGAALMSRSAAQQVEEMLRLEDFHHPSHRRIFAVMAHLLEEGSPVDQLSVEEELKQRGELERCGGMAYILTLANSVPTAAHVDYYARTVAEKATLRRVIAAAREAIRDSQEQVDEVDVIAERAQRRMEQAADRSGNATDVPTLRQAAFTVVHKITQAQSGDPEPIGISTGFPLLDEKRVFLRRGDFIVAGGRPSMGKTADWLQILVNVAEAHGPALMFSQEMDLEALLWRAVSFRAMVEATALQEGRYRDGLLLAPELVERCYAKVGQLSDLPLYVEDQNGVTLQDVRARCRRVARQEAREAREAGRESRPLQLVVVDYIQLMEAPGLEGGNEKMTAISRGLKKIARDFDVPVVALSQLSRRVEQREDKRPMMSDLRDSGSIEAEADLVMLYYRSRYYQREGEPDPYEPEPAETIIAKYRNGQVGTIYRTFTPAYAAFDLPIDTRHAGYEPEGERRWN